MTDELFVLNETIHQPTRLRIMTLLVSLPETDRLAYAFIQKTLDLTGGNLTTHLRKLEDGDEAMLVSAALMLAVVVLGAWRIRKSGVH